MYQGEPFVPVPGANLFISRENVTTEPNELGERTVICHPISDVHSGIVAAKGIRLMIRLLALSGAA